MQKLQIDLLNDLPINKQNGHGSAPVDWGTRLRSPQHRPNYSATHSSFETNFCNPAFRVKGNCAFFTIITQGISRLPKKLLCRIFTWLEWAFLLNGCLWSDIAVDFGRKTVVTRRLSIMQTEQGSSKITSCPFECGHEFPMSRHPPSGTLIGKHMIDE